MKNKHPKLALAKKMLTLKEVRSGTGPFQSGAWSLRAMVRFQKEKQKWDNGKKR